MTTHSKSVPSRIHWLAWLPLLVSVILMVLIVVLRVSLCLPTVPDLPARWGWLPTAFSALGFGVLCGLIMTYQPRNRIGWLCGTIALAAAVVNIPSVATDCAEQAAIPISGIPYLIWLAPFGGLLISLEFFLLPLWFPDGRFLSPGWRRFAVAAYGLIIFIVLLMAFWPGRMWAYGSSGQTVLENPFGLPFTPSSTLTRLVQVFQSIALVGSFLIAQFSLYARWRRSEGLARQQIKVFTYYLVTIGAFYMLFQFTALLLQNLDLNIMVGMFGGWLYLVLLVLLWAGYPIAVGAAVLKYRMYDVDVIIRRTLVYSVLSGLLALVYFSMVVLLQSLFDSVSGQQSPIAIVITTLVIAALFAPLRRRIQDVIDRRFYRKKYNAQQVLAQFAQTARDETDMDKLMAELVRVVQETMQPEHVSVWFKNRGSKSK